MSQADALLAVLDALPHGITLIDGEQRLIHANPAFWTVVGVDRGVCPPGTPVRDLARLLAYRGLFGPGDPEAQVAATLAVDRSRPSRRRLRTADGRFTHDVTSVPLPGGGYVTCAHDITNLARAEAEAQARARLVETVLSHLSDGIVAYDEQQRVTLANGAFETLTGLPAGAARRGMTHRDLLAIMAQRGEFMNDDALAEIAERADRDRTRPSTRLRERPSGEVLQFESHPLPDGGFVVEVDDITALKRAEDEAMRRAALIDGVLETLPYGVCIYGPDRRVQRFNRTYAAMMQGTTVSVTESLDEVVARRLAQGEYDEPTAARVLARFAPGADLSTVMQRVRPNGTVLENRMARLPDGGLISVFTEVTALHRAEEAARQRAMLLDGVLAAMPHGVCVYGADRRVAMFNDAYGRLMRGAPVAVGDHVDEVAARRVAAGEYGGDYAAHALARRTGEGASTDEAVRTRPDGTVIAVRAAPLPDGGHISVVTDVTALHRAEAAARERAGMLDAVLEALPDGVVVYGADRRARVSNAAYRRIMGDAAAQLGESLEELADRRVAAGEQTRAMADALLQRHFGAETETGRPIRRLRPDGTAIVSRAGRLPDGGHVAVITDVTALHQAEEELRRRSAVLEASFGAMRHGLAIFGPDHRLVAANQRTPSLTGLPTGSHRPGRTFAELVDDQVSLGVLTLEQAAAVVTIDRARPHRYLRHLADGRIVEILSDPTPDGGFVITYSDVTALQHAEAELGRRAAMLEASFAAMRHGIAIFAPDQRLIAVNARTADLTGLSPDILQPGRHFAELLDAQVAAGIITPQDRDAARRVDRAGSFHGTRMRPDGRIIETLTEPTPDGGFVASFTDVTALRRAEAELRQRAAMQDAMLATIRHGIVLYGPDRRALAANRKTYELTGMPDGQSVVGRRMDDLLDAQVARGQMPAAVAAEMKALDRSRSLRYGRGRPDGGVIDIVSEPTPDGGYVITYSDVTDERRIRAELERARAEAEAASEAKSRFLATMSHELRTPLHAVIGFSEAIGVETDPARVAEYATAVNEAGRHLLQLVDDILDVARSQNGALPTAEAPFAPAEVLLAALAAVAPVAESGGIVLATDLAEDLPWLRGDARRLRQALDKLLSNAVKFTPAGGRVTLSAGLGPDGLDIRVADTGIGISPEHRERMFEPFTQLDSSLSRRFPGSGLGLHLARLLASALGGTLTLEDADGPGIVARLRFPPDRLLSAPAPASPLPA